jgi:hypothetical protein
MASWRFFLRVSCAHHEFRAAMFWLKEGGASAQGDSNDMNVVETTSRTLETQMATLSGQDRTDRAAEDRYSRQPGLCPARETSPPCRWDRIVERWFGRFNVANRLADALRERTAGGRLRPKRPFAAGDGHDSLTLPSLPSDTDDISFNSIQTRLGDFSI